MDNENDKGKKGKKNNQKSEEQQIKKREKSFIRMQKKHRDKRLKELAAGIANKRKTFEEMGLAYNTDEDGAEEFDSTHGFSDCDVSDVLSAPSYSGPPSADRMSSSSNDPARKKVMEIRTEDTLTKVRRWFEQTIQLQKESAFLDKAFELTQARNDARTRRAKAVFRKSQSASVSMESGPA